MHHSLQVSEILLQIVHEVAGHISSREHWDTGQGQRRALASMARTCKLFYEPSMNALWEVLLQVDHLLACVGLPPGPFLCAGTHRNSTNSTSRCLANAARVRSFSANGTACVQLIKNMDLVRRFIPTPGPLLPHLWKLDVVMQYSYAEAVYDAADLILSPSIRRLAFRTGLREHALYHRLLERAGDICPDIIYLNTVVLPNHPLALSSFNQLEHFVSRSVLPAEALAHLASLCTLSTLDINAPPSIQILSPLSHSGGFAHLRILHIFCSSSVDDRSFIAPLLRTISSRTLQTIRIYARIHSNRDNDITYLNDIILAVSNFASLCDLELTAGCKTGIDGCDLRPLQRLHRLKSLTLSLDRIRPNLSDANLPQYGGAWPGLELFQLVHIGDRRYDHEQPHTLTLTALSEFARYFPRLKFFRGCLDATTVDLTADLQHLPSTSRLSELDIRTSRIGKDTKAIAAYISAVCPLASLVSVYNSVSAAEIGSERWQAWYAVERIVNGAAGARVMSG